MAITDVPATAAMPKTSCVFEYIWMVTRIDVDYTSHWDRGSPPTFIDNLTFKKVLTDKPYRYRVVAGSSDLGVKEAYEVQLDGSQKLNFLEWNKGFGINDKETIKVYVVDPVDDSSTLIAQWN
jgi:hypothetical protein